MLGVSIDEAAGLISDPLPEILTDDNKDSIRRLRSEIAYLSKMQRRVVILYYFENQKQADIARELDIPLGTVKWHLFEAKKELKRGMDTMRKTSDLKFNPIKFHSCGINGSIGTKSLDEFFRSALSQNICYCVRNTAMTINEIADKLGVSPVYIESEAEFLEEYGFLQVHGNKYIVNFIISEPTAELLTMQNDMYKRASELFANDLYDEITSSGILDNPAIVCRQTDEPICLTKSPRTDYNFILWSLIPYIAACSGEKLMNEKISFEEVSTVRPDGANNIVHAAVVSENIILPDDYVYMKNWCGPMWNGDGERILWQIDSQWSDRDNNKTIKYSEEAKRILSLYSRDLEGRLTKDEYAWLAERGFVKTNGDYDGYFKSSWQIVILSNKEIQTKLLDIGERLKVKYKKNFDELKKPYADVVINSVPSHLRKIKEYELQFTFHSDGWFLIHCINTLIKNGKLKEPTETQKKSLTTLIVNN